jgi:hypothetical protein
METLKKRRYLQASPGK